MVQKREMVVQIRGMDSTEKGDEQKRKVQKKKISSADKYK